MKRRYLAFDLETATRLPSDCPPWGTFGHVGISCAATCACDSDEPRLWFGCGSRQRPASRMAESEVRRLVRYLATQVQRGYTILTWNGLGFDFRILAEESGLSRECCDLAVEHVDMMFHVLCRLGFGVALESGAKGLGVGTKRAGVSGCLIPQLWKEGRHEEVLDYVANDAKLTLAVAEACEKRGHFCWLTGSGRRRFLSLSNGWLVVRSAMKLPPTRNSPKSGVWSRSRFMAWLPTS